MKPTKWWIQSGVVYGVTALIGIALMWYSGNWKLSRVAWLMALVSVVFLVGGGLKHYRFKASSKHRVRLRR
jgi:hypothetical protein